MIATLVQSAACEILVTITALKCNSTCEELPINGLPLDLLASEELYELV